MAVSKTTPTRQDRRAITRLLGRLLMELDEFIDLYPAFTRPELADIADASIDVVDHWFMEPPNQRQPTKYHKLRFALAHWLWTQDRASPSVFEELREIGKPDDPN